MKTFYLLLTLLTFLTCSQKEIEQNNAEPLLENTFENRLSEAALSIIDDKVVYTPNYVAIKYPN